MADTSADMTPDTTPASSPASTPASTPDPPAKALDQSHVVIVGGGLAGWRAAEELRAAGFGGRLTLLSEEEHPPYDTPPLSKRLLKADVEATPFHFAREGSDEASLRLDLRSNVRATGLRPGVVV